MYTCIYIIVKRMSAWVKKTTTNKLTPIQTKTRGVHCAKQHQQLES